MKKLTKINSFFSIFLISLLFLFCFFAFRQPSGKDVINKKEEKLFKLVSEMTVDKAVFVDLKEYEYLDQRFLRQKNSPNKNVIVFGKIKYYVIEKDDKYILFYPFSPVNNTYHLEVGDSLLNMNDWIYIKKVGGPYLN